MKEIEILCNKLIKRANIRTEIDVLSLRNATGKKYIDILKTRDLALYILIENYPELTIKDLKALFPSIKYYSVSEIRMRTHKRMNGDFDYIDLYLKLKNDIFRQ
jgi:hypothetical protein